MTYQIKIDEDFDASAVSQMRSELDRFALISDDLEIDMTKVRFMDSSGVGAIVFLFKRCRTRGYKIECIGLQGQPLKLLQHLGIAALVTSDLGKKVA
jgi:anti-anti-sigma factor